MTTESIIAQLRRLEVQLLQRRVPPEELALLLADDFIEIGSSGRHYDKQATLQLLRNNPSLQATIDEFQVHMLAADIVLATFVVVRVDNPEHQSRRSSIWQMRDDRWQIMFHQGTPIVHP